jgi:polyferredoxin
VLGAAILITALLLRSAFCGWICPFGLLQDLVSNLRNVLKKRLPGLRRGFARVGKFPVWAFLDRYLRFAKYLVLAWAIGGAAFFGTMVFRDVDPWSALLNLAEFSITPGVIVLGLTLVASFFVDRPWCRYACPLGAASGLLGMLSPFHLRREETACTSCKLCSRSCPMGLKVHEIKSVHHSDCIGCLECVDACPRSGAMEIQLDLPLSNR